MTAATYDPVEDIATVQSVPTSKEYWAWDRSIDVSDTPSASKPGLQFIISQGRVESITTIPDAIADETMWLRKAAQRLADVAQLPENWDDRGSPPPRAEILASAAGLLWRLQVIVSAELPAPIISPIHGGTFQLEWTSDRKHVEIEFLDDNTVVILKEQVGPQRPMIVSDELPVSRIDAIRDVLHWFVRA